MTFLFAAGELESFDGAAGANVNTITTAGRFDSDFARCAMKVTGDAFFGADFASSTEAWLHFEVYHPVLPDNDLDFATVQLIDIATGQVVIAIDPDNGGTWAMEYWNGSTFTTVDFDSDFTNATLHRVDINWKIADAGGFFSIYIDETLVATFAGDTLLTGFTTIDRVRFLGGDNIASSTSTEINYSQVIVSTTDTRGLHLATIDITGAGTTSAWTGSNIDVDDEAISDGDFLESGSANQVETMAAANLSATANALAVRAVMLGMRAQRGAAGPQNLQGAVRVNATDYFSTSVSGLITSLQPFQALWAVSPDTSVVWTNAEIDALEVGVKSIT